MKENYRIYKKFGKDIIKNNDILRIDLFNNYKIKDIKELKEFLKDNILKSEGEYNMKKFKYIKNHNNYEFELNKSYEGYKYKEGWINIKGQLYREECFIEVI